jgi:hypothetical protein
MSGRFGEAATRRVDRARCYRWRKTRMRTHPYRALHKKGAENPAISKGEDDSDPQR